MFGRVATFDQINLDAVEPVMEWFEENRTEVTARLPGYEGGLTLLDRDRRRVIDIFLFDSELNARAADELMDQGPPRDMPRELKTALRGAKRRFRAVMEVIDSDGILSELAEPTA